MWEGGGIGVLTVEVSKGGRDMLKFYGRLSFKICLIDKIHLINVRYIKFRHKIQFIDTFLFSFYFSILPLCIGKPISHEINKFVENKCFFLNFFSLMKTVRYS